MVKKTSSVDWISDEMGCKACDLKNIFININNKSRCKRNEYTLQFDNPINSGEQYSKIDYARLLKSMRISHVT